MKSSHGLTADAAGRVHHCGTTSTVSLLNATLLRRYPAGDDWLAYRSAYIDGCESVLVVPLRRHSVQDNPVAIDELRRILFLHATVDAEPARSLR